MPERKHLRIVTVLDPYSGPGGLYNFQKDSSHLVLLELERRGHVNYYADPSSLTLSPNGVAIRARRVRVLEAEPYFEFLEDLTLEPRDLSAILMRKDPPFDEAYLHTVMLLSLAARDVPVLNDARALLRWNEKLVIFQFPRLIPRTIVTSSCEVIDSFLRGLERKSALVKPLDGFAGRGVEKLDLSCPSYDATLNRLTSGCRRPIMVQEFLQNIALGEKRVFLLDGSVLGALLRIPPPGEFLTSPDRGGTIRPASLTAVEREICGEVGEFLRKEDIFFAGIDLIDQRLTEINITSPGLLWEWNALDGARHEQGIVDALEKRLA